MLFGLFDEPPAEDRPSVSPAPSRSFVDDDERSVEYNDILDQPLAGAASAPARGGEGGDYEEDEEEEPPDEPTEGDDNDVYIR